MVSKLGALLPAETDTTTPAAMEVSTALHLASSGWPKPPRLIDMTSAWSEVSPSPLGSVAISMPAMTMEEGPDPLSDRTL